MPSVKSTKPTSLFSCISECAAQTPEAKIIVPRKGATPLGTDENDSAANNLILAMISVEASEEEEVVLPAPRRLTFLGATSPSEHSSVEIMCVQETHILPTGGSEPAPWTVVASAASAVRHSVTAYSTNDKYWCHGEVVAVSEDGSRVVVRFADKSEEWAALPGEVYYGEVGMAKIKMATKA